MTLSYQGGSGDGAYTVSLTPRLSVYGGTIVGATQTKVVNIVGSTFVNTTFNFGNAPVPPGSTVTFTQILVSGPVVMNPVLYYDVGSGTCTDVTQTNGTTPPLDSFRRNSVGLVITGALTAAASAIPSLSQYALLLLASLLAFAGIAYARRRR